VNQQSRRVRLGLESDSVFPPEEGPSLNSRPTPLVPASAELRSLGTRSHPPAVLRSHPPAVAHDDPREMQITQPDGLAHGKRPEAVTTEPPSPWADGQRPSARPTASFGPARNPEQDFFEAAPGPPKLSSLPPVRGRPKPRSHARAIFARVLFVMIFAGMATLLVVAIKKKLELKKVDSLSAFVR